MTQLLEMNSWGSQRIGGCPPSAEAKSSEHFYYPPASHTLPLPHGHSSSILSEYII